MDFNKLQISGQPPRLTVELPVFRASAFEASPEQLLQHSQRTFGSSAFELADMLQLLPDQTRSSVLEMETKNLQDLVYDDHTYYCTCSRTDLLRFVNQHFSRVRETSGRVIVETDVGLFTFIHTDRHLIVRFNGNEKAPEAIAPASQDYDSLRKCASGLWCIRDDDDIVRPGKTQHWQRLDDVDDLLLSLRIEHKNSIYFLSQRTYQDIELRVRFARDLGEALQKVCARIRDTFATPELELSFDMFTTTCQRSYSNPEGLGIITAGFSLILNDAFHLIYRQRADQLSQSQSPSQDKLDRDKTDFMTQCLSLRQDLFSVYEATPSILSLQNRLIEVVKDAPALVFGQCGLSLKLKACGQIILHRSVGVPEEWLVILRGGDGNVLVG